MTSESILFIRGVRCTGKTTRMSAELKPLGKKACVIVTSLTDVHKGFYKDNVVI